MESDKVIGIDVGGTNIKGVLISRKGKVLESVVRETDKNGSGWKDTVQEVFAHLQINVKGEIPVGLSAPGISNKAHDAIAHMPGRLEGLEGFNWTDFLKLKSVKVLNDAHSALLAEGTFGAGKGVSNLVMLTLGTGIGGGIMINGAIYEGFHGLAGHFGHISLNGESNELGITKMPGSLEDAFGEASIVRRSHGRFHSVSELVDAYVKRDHFATYLWLKSVRKLSIGICSICNVLSPEMIVIGGGISNANEALFDPLKSFMDLYEWRPEGIETKIAKAQFSELAGAIGAATFAFQNQ